MNAARVVGITGVIKTRFPVDGQIGASTVVAVEPATTVKPDGAESSVGVLDTVVD